MAGELTANGKLEEVERLWDFSRSKGLSRKAFLKLLTFGGSAAVLAACGEIDGQPTPTPTQEEEAAWAKDTEPFIIRGTNLETRLENLDGWITPTEKFFVRNNAPASPRIDVNNWQLRVEGDAVSQPLELTYEEIMEMPSRTVISYIECAGNQRNLFEEVLGQQAEGGEWITGGISQGIWTGVPLAHILERAGVSDNAVAVNVKGLDTDAPEEGFNRTMTFEKAMDEDTIMAYVMNGETLPVDHGYPLRAVVPGWVGSTNIKWAGLITVSSEWIWSRNNTTSYVLIGPEWPPEEYGPADGEPLTTQNIKSALALPWPADLSPGNQIIPGFAFSPHAPIERVEWSDDGGQNWQEARLVSPNPMYSWVRFEFEWDAPSGEQGLMTRATDEMGNTQPDTIPFNEKGYLFNMTYQHPVNVG